MTNVRQRKARPGKSHAQSPGKIYVMTPLAAAIVAALSPTIPVLAQESAARIDEIIVTATKRAMNMQDLAQSIAVLTNEEIERQGIISMEDYIKALPSITLSAWSPGRNKIVFRGMSTGSDEWRTDSQAAVYLDEVPMTAVSQQLDAWMVDIERVESLPGPQGTLFGASSQSGALRIITNKPDPEAFAGAVDVDFSNTSGGGSSYDISGTLNIPLADNFAIRIVGYDVEQGGWIDNVPGTSVTGLQDNDDVVEDDWNTWEVTGARLGALWDISDSWSALLSVIRQETHSEGSWTIDPALGDDKSNNFFKDYRDDDWSMYALTIKGDIGNVEFSSTTAYVDRDIAYEWDNHIYDAYKSTAAHYCAYAYYPSTCYLGGLYDLDYILGTRFNDQIQERFTQEFRLASTSDSRFQWMIGLFYEDVDDNWDAGSYTPGMPNTPSWSYANYWAGYYSQYYDVTYPLPMTDVWWDQEYRRNTQTTAVFGEVTFDVTDAWSMTFGGRWFENERDRYVRETFPSEFPSWGQMELDGTDEAQGKQDDTTFKFGTQYNFNDNVMAYFIFSQGFRLGGDNSVRAAEAGFVYEVYDPDKVDNYEVGVKSTFAGGRVQLNASAFFMEWDEIQLNRTNPDIWWQQGVQNGGKAETQGLELSITVHATDNFKIMGSFFAADGEYTEDIYWLDPQAGTDPLIVDEVLDTPAGTPMPFSPDYKYWIGLDWTIPQAMFGGDLWFRYDFSGQSDSYGDRGLAEEGIVDIPAWNVSNLSVGWLNDDGWEARLYANNVWDQQYVQWFNRGDNGTMDDWFPSDDRYHNMRNYNRPREIGVRLTKKF